MHFSDKPSLKTALGTNNLEPYQLVPSGWFATLAQHNSPNNDFIGHSCFYKLTGDTSAQLTQPRTQMLLPTLILVAPKKLGPVLANMSLQYFICFLMLAAVCSPDGIRPDSELFIEVQGYWTSRERRKRAKGN